MRRLSHLGLKGSVFAVFEKVGRTKINLHPKVTNKGKKRLKILLIIEQRNPDMASLPLERYKYFQAINKLVDATLVTHERNKKPLEKLKQYNNIFYIEKSKLTKKYFPLIARMTLRNRNNRSLANALGYPIYAEFDRKVYQQFQEPILRGDYDLVHALTPMIPRYPVKAVKACRQTSFLLEPVN